MGFRYIDDIVQEDMKKKQQMEETMADLKLNNEIISAISKMYRIIYRMDLIHDTYEEISSQESMHRLTGRSGKTSVKFTKAREKFIAPEFQERMREFLDVSTLAERLKNREEVSTEYRALLRKNGEIAKRRLQTENMRARKNTSGIGNCQIPGKWYGIMLAPPDIKKIVPYNSRTGNTRILLLRIIPDMETE